jgi:hypothetical protein
MILIVSWSWHLHGAAHEVYINTLARIVVTWGDGVDLCSSAALESGDKTEAIFVFSSSKLVRSRPGEVLGEVLEAGILGGFGPQSVHNALHLLYAGCVVVLSGAWHAFVNLLILLDEHLLEMFARETEAESAALRLFLEG